jgi:Flp pilus assembly protein CpaB
MASSSGTSILKGRWTVWIIALVFSLLAGFGVLTIIGSAAEQQTYYVVTADIPARTPITPANTTAVATSAEGYPRTALTLAQIESGQFYSLVPLRGQEIVTVSNAGTLTPITDFVPEDYVAVSLSVSAENAVAGRIKAGDLVDIAAVADGTASRFARVVLSGVLVLDVSVAPSSIAAAANSDPIGTGVNPGGGTGPDSTAARDGIPTLYTFAVSLKDFATLALLRDKNVYLALANPANAVSGQTAESTEAEIFGSPIPVPQNESILEEEVIVGE